MAFEIVKYHGSYNKSNRSGSIMYLVIHYVGSGTSAPGSALANCKYFSNGNRNASADYFIDDATICEFNDPSSGKYTWAVGDGGGKYGITNSNSIHIEVCMNYDNPFTNNEIARLTWLTQHLMAKYHIPASRVVEHWHASRKSCPLFYSKRSSEWSRLHAQITGGEVGDVPQTAPATEVRDWLQKGDRGSAVAVLQNKLIACGYNCGGYGPDGIFGAGTEESVRAFQRDHGLKDDGLAGVLTNAKLSEVLKGVNAQAKTETVAFPLPAGHWFGMPSSDDRNHSGYYNAVERTYIAKIQGFLGVATDGYYGSVTRNAVYNYQKKNPDCGGADGLAGVKTWNSLFN